MDAKQPVDADPATAGPRFLLTELANFLAVSESIPSQATPVVHDFKHFGQ